MMGERLDFFLLSGVPELTNIHELCWSSIPHIWECTLITPSSSPVATILDVQARTRLIAELTKKSQLILRKNESPYTDVRTRGLPVFLQ